MNWILNEMEIKLKVNPPLFCKSWFDGARGLQIFDKDVGQTVQIELKRSFFFIFNTVLHRQSLLQSTFCCCYLFSDFNKRTQKYSYLLKSSTKMRTRTWYWQLEHAANAAAKNDTSKKWANDKKKSQFWVDFNEF